MEHGCDIEELRVETKAPTLSSQRTPKIDTCGVLKQERTLGILNKLRCVTSQLAVWDLYRGDFAGDHWLYKIKSRATASRHRKAVVSSALHSEPQISTSGGKLAHTIFR